MRRGALQRLMSVKEQPDFPRRVACAIWESGKQVTPLAGIGKKELNRIEWEHDPS